VFNNHRVARRFSRRNQRVVKIPDGSVIRKTQPYLQAKGHHPLAARRPSLFFELRQL
jgi:hypothetical protein